MTCWPFSSMKSRLVRRPRKHSSMRLFLFSWITMEPVTLVLQRGNSPRMGAWVIFWTSSRFSILYLSVSRKNTSPIGSPKPMINAANAIIIFLGAIGAVPGKASSMMRPLVAVDARVIAFSSRFCNNMV